MYNMQYEFIPELFLRAPFYSFADYSLKQLPDVLQKEEFKNAIYLASPDFYHAIEKKGFDFNNLEEKEKFSLYKYYNRMSFRPTPFGSFASITNLNWGNDGLIQLNNEKDVTMHLLPDQALRTKISGFLARESDNFDIILNPTLYGMANEFRFTKTIEDSKGHLTYTLNSISQERLNRKIIKLLDNKVITLKSLTEWIRDQTTCSIEEAKDYAAFLINEQVLYTIFNGNIIEQDNHEKPSTYNRELFLKIQQFWNNSKSRPIKDVQNLPGESKLLETFLNEIPLKVGSNHFYSAIERNINTGGLNCDYQQQLMDVIDVLQKIAEPSVSVNLENFIKDFQARFDKEKIPLLLAMDPDYGIGYGNLQSGEQNEDILDNIFFPLQKQEKKQLHWTKTHEVIFKRWVMDLNRKPHMPIVIHSEDIDYLDEKETKLFPSTLAVLFRKSNEKLYIESIGGATATSLVGRFSVFSDETAILCRKLAAAEMAAHPDVIFADMGLLSDTHTDNINRRLRIYDFEIPINVYSELPLTNQIRPEDILVSVDRGQVLLESVKMKKRIIPRLSTAFNYNNNSLAIFRFLCDLQHQGLQSSLSFEMERLFPNMGFYPRVEFKKTIISPATWKITGDDLEMLKNCPAIKILETLSHLRKKHCMPSKVTIGTADQQLIFNLNEEEDLRFFMECVEESKRKVQNNPRKNFSVLTIKEFIESDNSVISNSKPLIGQFIGILSHSETIYKKRESNKLIIKKNIQRNFIIGSEWLYFKIYCTPKTSGIVLLEIVVPVLNKYSTQINKWFFIRYNENGYHLRLRILVNNGEQSTIIHALEKSISVSRKIEFVKDFEAGLYRREMERYGSDLIDEIEDFFSIGSNLTVKIIESANSRKISQSTFQMAIWTIHSIINNALTEMSDQMAFINYNLEAFLKEFTADKLLKVDLDKKYRELSRDIMNVLDHEFLTTESDQVLLKYKKQLLSKWSSIANSLNDPNRKVALLADLVHMQINRLFPFDQRKYEMLIYYCLNKYSLSKIAKSKNKQVNF